MSIISDLPVDAGARRFAGPQGFLPAGEQVGTTDYAIQYVRPTNHVILVQSAPTLTVAGAYVTGDYIGPSTAPASFASAVRVAGARARVRSLTITDKTVTAAVALEVWLFSATLTVPADNAAWDITDANALLCQGVIPLSTAKWYATASNKVYSDDTLNLVVAPAATALFYALVARGSTPTWVSGDLQLSLGLETA